MSVYCVSVTRFRGGDRFQLLCAGDPADGANETVSDNRLFPSLRCASVVARHDSDQMASRAVAVPIHVTFDGRKVDKDEVVAFGGRGRFGEQGDDPLQTQVELPASGVYEWEQYLESVGRESLDDRTGDLVEPVVSHYESSMLVFQRHCRRTRARLHRMVLGTKRAATGV